MNPRQSHRSGALSRVCPERSIAKGKSLLRDLDTPSSGRDQGLCKANCSQTFFISGHLKLSDSKELGSEKPRKHNTEAQIPVVIGVLITSHVPLR